MLSTRRRFCLFYTNNKVIFSLQLYLELQLKHLRIYKLYSLSSKIKKASDCAKVNSFHQKKCILKRSIETNRI